MKHRSEGKTRRPKKNAVMDQGSGSERQQQVQIKEVKRTKSDMNQNKRVTSGKFQRWK